MTDAPDSAATRGKWLALVAAFLGWMFDGMEMGLFPLAGRPALKELMGVAGAPNADQLIGQWFGAIIAAFLVGAALGGVLFGWLGDRIGRVRAMVWSVATYSIFSGLCAFVTAPWQLAVLRFIASLGMGGEWALGVALVMEIWPTKSRPVLAGLIGAAANVGFMLIGFVSLTLIKYGGKVATSWRMLFLVGAVPALLTFLIRLFVPESEKWKHATQNAPKPRVGEIFAPGIVQFTILGACLAGVALLGTWGSVQWIPPWTNRMTGDASKTAWAQIYMAMGAIVLPLVVAVLAEKLNRRVAYFGLCLGSLIICQYLFRVPQEYGVKFLLLVTVANGITAGFYGWLPLYLPELFPTRMRATGSGFTFNIGRIIAAVGTLQAGNLLKEFGGDYAQMCAVISLIYAVGLVLIWFCPETKGRPLPA